MNDAPAPPNPGTEQIMKFIVSDKLVSPDKSEIPNEMMHFHKINPSSAVKERTMHLDETIDHYGRTMHLLNNKTWDEPATERPKMDTVEIWHLVNHFDFPHPIHIHLVRFEVLGRKVFTDADFDEEGNYLFNQDSLPPPLDYEIGPKDTVRTDQDR